MVGSTKTNHQLTYKHVDDSVCQIEQKREEHRRAQHLTFTTKVSII